MSGTGARSMASAAGRAGIITRAMFTRTQPLSKRQTQLR